MAIPLKEFMQAPIPMYIRVLPKETIILDKHYITSVTSCLVFFSCNTFLNYADLYKVK